MVILWNILDKQTKLLVNHISIHIILQQLQFHSADTHHPCPQKWEREWWWWPFLWEWWGEAEDFFSDSTDVQAETEPRPAGQLPQAEGVRSTESQVRCTQQCLMLFYTMFPEAMGPPFAHNTVCCGIFSPQFFSPLHLGLAKFFSQSIPEFVIDPGRNSLQSIGGSKVHNDHLESNMHSSNLMFYFHFTERLLKNIVPWDFDIVAFLTFYGWNRDPRQHVCGPGRFE